MENTTFPPAKLDVEGIAVVGTKEGVYLAYQARRHYSDTAAPAPVHEYRCTETITAATSNKLSGTVKTWRYPATARRAFDTLGDELKKMYEEHNRELFEILKGIQGVSLTVCPSYKSGRHYLEVRHDRFRFAAFLRVRDKQTKVALTRNF